MLAAIVYSGVMSFVLLKVIGAHRPAAGRCRRDESVGLDVSMHGEEAYVHGVYGGMSSPAHAHGARRRLRAWRLQVPRGDGIGELAEFGHLAIWSSGH